MRLQTNLVLASRDDPEKKALLRQQGVKSSVSGMIMKLGLGGRKISNNHKHAKRVNFSWGMRAMGNLENMRENNQHHGFQTNI